MANCIQGYDIRFCRQLDDDCDWDIRHNYFETIEEAESAFEHCKGKCKTFPFIQLCECEIEEEHGIKQYYTGNPIKEWCSTETGIELITY